MLQAAARIADGEVPVQRLLVVLPAGPALPARRALGAVRPVAAVRGGSCACSRPGRSRCWRGGSRARGGAPPLAALGAWLAAALALAYPSGPHPFPITLALALGALLLLERAGARGRAGGRRRVLAARVRRLPGARRAARVRGAAAGGRARRRASRAPRPSAAAALLFAPFVIAAGPGDAFDLLIRYPLLDFSRLPVAAVPARLRRPAEHRLARRLPVGLGREPAALLPAAGARARAGRPRWRRWRCASDRERLVAGWRSRCSRSAWRTTCWRAPTSSTPAPLAVMVAVLAAWALAAGGRARPRIARPSLRGARRRAASRRRSRLALRGRRGADRAGSLRAPAARRSRSPVADGVRVPPPSARDARGDGAPRSSARVPPGEPIYVVPRAHRPRHRRATRCSTCSPTAPNPTRYDIQAPGVVTSRAGPARDRRRPRAHPPARSSCATRRRSPRRASPTPPGRSSGVTLLDEYLGEDLPRGRAPRRAACCSSAASP